MFSVRKSVSEGTEFVRLPRLSSKTMHFGRLISTGTILLAKFRSPGGSLSSLGKTFLIAKTQQQCFQLTKCLLLIGPDSLEDDTGATIPIGSKHFQQAGG